ncbi:unnamed protein product [Prunus brigantina]
MAQILQTRHECQVYLLVHALSQSKPVMGPSKQSLWLQLKDCVLLMDVFDLCHSRDGRKRMHNWYSFGGVMQWNI